MAKIAKTYSIKFIHLSTDYVFDGTHSQPYIETAPCHPLGVYGSSKRAGESAILSINPLHSIILRTSWVYSSYGSNFVKTIIRLASEKESIDVVSDQVGTPTYARDIASTILTVLDRLDNKDVEIYHFSNEGVATWYDFASAIISMKHLSCHVRPILSKDFPTLVKRPSYSVLCKDKIKQCFGLAIPSWRDSLKECLSLE